MRLSFHPAARGEFIAAADYYEAAVSGLGDRFLQVVRGTTAMLLQHPEAGSVRVGQARRVVVTGFPYDVVHQVRHELLEVIAIAHHRRRPGYWRERVIG